MGSLWAILISYHSSGIPQWPAAMSCRLVLAFIGRNPSTNSLGAMGSHLTIQQLTHCSHLKLLGWVALQPLFIAFGVRRHYERQEHEIVSE